MKEFADILEIVTWPATLLIIVLMLRGPITKLIPNMRRLKYKDLEVEFEKEILEIRAKVDRDLPKLPTLEKEVVGGVEEEQPMFSRARASPDQELVGAWNSLERAIYSLMDRKGISYSPNDPIRVSVGKILGSGAIDEFSAALILDLSMFRNKIHHAGEDFVNHEISSAFGESSHRIVSKLDAISA